MRSRFDEQLKLLNRKMTEMGGECESIIAAAGKAVTPGGAVEICRILGKEETLRRLRIGLEKLN